MLCVRADGFCSPAITNISLDTNTIHFNPSNVLLYQTRLLLLHNILLKNMYSLPDNGINLLLQDYYECIPFFA